jgi:bifunctional non-homologous end joining protein LigD
MRFIEPCLPTISRAVPEGPGWAYEIKRDGFRFLAVRHRKQMHVYSRGGHDWAERLPAIVNALRALPVRSVVLDGEGVICGPDGRSEFDCMRACFSRQGAPRAFLYAFDVLELDGRDMRTEPWAARRTALVSLVTDAHQGIRLCEHIEDTDGAVVFRAACNLGLEGIVAKRVDSRYRSGRCRDWIKVKNPAHPAIERAMLIALSKRRHSANER